MKNYLKSNGEILRYLGYCGQTIDENINELIEKQKAELLRHFLPKRIYGRFSLKRQNNGIALCGTEAVFCGVDIKNHLKNCNEAVLLAVTLGQQSAVYLEALKRRSTLDAVVFDAAATALVEEACEYAEDEIRKKLLKEGLYLTARFSCGYGDFPVSEQKNILSALNAERLLGITMISDNMMLPEKSVTAVMGISKEKIKGNAQGCFNCNKKDVCGFKKCLKD